MSRKLTTRPAAPPGARLFPAPLQRSTPTTRFVLDTKNGAVSWSEPFVLDTTPFVLDTNAAVIEYLAEPE